MHNFIIGFVSGIGFIFLLDAYGNLLEVLKARERRLALIKLGIKK